MTATPPKLGGPLLTRRAGGGFSRTMPTVQPEDNPSVALIKKAFERYELEKWTNDRVARLCSMLQVELEELCALAGVFDPQEVAYIWKKCAPNQGSGQPYWPTSMALHFAKLEQYVSEQFLQTASPPDPQDVQTARLICRRT